MLSKKCFTREWIDTLTGRLAARNPRLVETCIHAFELVGRLAAAGLDFVFKGGTSVLLHLQPFRRLSIDVDIITPVGMDELQRVLREVCRPPFGQFQYQDWRARENPPTRYFQIPYHSPTLGGQYALQLDVQTGANPYPVVETKAITLDLLDVETPQSVRVPSIDCLLGDKLTAFAPSTIGVLYAPLPRNPGDRQPEPMPIQALKQLFDVGELFMAAGSLPSVAQAYDRVYAVQNDARGGGYAREQCLNDTLEAAFLISQMQLRQEVRNERTAFLNRGIRELDSHILGPAFDMRAAKLQAARVAHLAALLRTGRLDVPLATVRQMPPLAELAALTIAGPYDRLAALRQTSPEAFYGWYQASQLLA